MKGNHSPITWLDVAAGVLEGVAWATVSLLVIVAIWLFLAMAGC